MSKATLYLRKVSITEEPELVAKIGKLFSTDFGTNGFTLADGRIIGQHFFALQDDKGALYAAAAGRIDEEDPSLFKGIIKENNAELCEMRVRVIPGNNSSEFYKKSGYESENGYEWPLFKTVKIE